MSLPTTLVNAEFPEQNSYLGPFLSSAGSVYIIVRCRTFLGGKPPLTEWRLEAHKSTNPPTIDFVEVDGVNHPTMINKIRTFWVFQDGDDLHIAAQEAGLVSNRVSYSVFHMTTDLWDTTINNEQVDDPADEVGSHDDLGVSIALRSDGDVIILYAGDRDRIKGTKYERTDYARKEEGTWTFGIQVDTGGEVRYKPGIIVRGADDRMHFFYAQGSLSATTDTNGRHRSLDNTNNLGTEIIYDTAPAFEFRYCSGVSYVSGVDTKVRVSINRSGDDFVHSLKLDSGADPIITLEVASDVEAVLSSPAWTFALDGTTVHLLYVENTIPSNIHHDKNADDAGWNTDDTEPVSGSGQISSNIYLRAGRKVLAYVYTDGTSVKYNELVLPPANLQSVVPIAAIPMFIRLRRRLRQQ